MLVAKLQDAEPLSSCCGFTISFCPGEQNTSSKSCVHKKVHPTKEEHSGAGSLVTDPFSKAKQKRVECTHKWGESVTWKANPWIFSYSPSALNLNGSDLLGCRTAANLVSDFWGDVSLLFTIHPSAFSALHHHLLQGLFLHPSPGPPDPVTGYRELVVSGALGRA